MLRLRSRTRWVLAAVALLSLAQFIAGSFPAAAATYWDGASPSHPFSNPQWWPVNGSDVAVGCYHGNGADCRNPLQHTVYAMDIVVPQRSSTPVYAMGAGIVHVESTGWRCNRTQSRGNWLYVDHGNGTRSEYGHLGRILVHTGDYVTARTKLAIVGQSGYAKCATYPGIRYLWLGVRHGSSYYHFRQTYTCVDGRRTVWPQQLPRPYAEWNSVPAHTVLPTSTRTCTPGTPATPTRPRSVTLVRAGHGAGKVSWLRGSTAEHVSAVTVQLQEYHPSIHRWLDYANRRLGATATTTTFTGLQARRMFRVRVWMTNSTGWSAPSSWHSAVIS
jgi:hypothetical protein